MSFEPRQKVLAQELAGVLGAESIHVDDLTDEELGSKGRLIARCFTTIVDMLKKDLYVDNVHINRLASDVWSIIGNNICLTAVHPRVKEVSFIVVRKKPTSSLTAAVLVPLNFVEMCQEHPYYQFGAVVFVASQVADFYNEKVENDSVAVKHRAKAYEAEYILAMRRRYADFVLNDYQRAILEEYPEGLSSLLNEYKYLPRAVPPPR